MDFCVNESSKKAVPKMFGCAKQIIAEGVRRNLSKLKSPFSLTTSRD